MAKERNDNNPGPVASMAEKSIARRAVLRYYVGRLGLSRPVVVYGIMM